MRPHEEMGLTPEEMADKFSDTLRFIERKNDSNWEPVRMKELNKGDHFRVSFPADDFHNQGEIVEYIAESKPFVNDHYRWEITCHPVHHKEAI